MYDRNREKVVISVDKLSKICWEKSFRKSFKVFFFYFLIWKKNIYIFFLVRVCGFDLRVFVRVVKYFVKEWLFL